MVVYTDSPKAAANQKQVMELLLINHPVDCPVCDQAGECHLQDYSYQYGRGESRFKEDKIKQPKKSVGPNILLYSDRCIMCTRCVRFTREVTGTNELLVEGRGATEEIDVFPGMALDNELASNVIDLCPVGALLDKDFLFSQRVWLLSKTPSIDGITSSGDNIFIEHNEGVVHRVKPRENLSLNTWWITDEVRYGWHFIHSDDRLRLPIVRGNDAFELKDAAEAWTVARQRAHSVIEDAHAAGHRVAIMVSPMLSCEDAYLLGKWVRTVAPEATLAVGPVPVVGEDKTFDNGFTVRAEKAPNARGVRRVLEALGGTPPLEADAFVAALGRGEFAAVVLTGNYPSTWASSEWAQALSGTPFILIDTLNNPLVSGAEVVLPSATFAEKAGTFQNALDRLQAFERAIAPIDYVKNEAQIGLDMLALHLGVAPEGFNPEAVRAQISSLSGLEGFQAGVEFPLEETSIESDMVQVTL
jgi:NADH-quinone oxidoreductase subunit G